MRPGLWKYNNPKRMLAEWIIDGYLLPEGEDNLELTLCNIIHTYDIMNHKIVPAIAGYRGYKP